MVDEYIRREDALKGKKTGTFANGICLVAESCVTVEYIESLEPVDVAPVKYGEWISTPEMWGVFDVRYYCSKCGNDAIINNRERYVLSDYCPHCGAIMDNKRGNENDR